MVEGRRRIEGGLVGHPSLGCWLGRGIMRCTTEEGWDIEAIFGDAS
jgi:hypothetical protein